MREKPARAKIAVTATGPSLDARVDACFGLGTHYLVVDLDSLAFEVLKNPSVDLGDRAGHEFGQLMAEKGVKAVVTGNWGLDAGRALAAAGIRMIPGFDGTVREAVVHLKTPVAESACGGAECGHERFPV